MGMQIIRRTVKKMKLIKHLIVFLFFSGIILSCKPREAPQQDTVEVEPDSIIEIAVTDTIAPPPQPIIDYDTLEWTDIAILDPSIIVDMKYATEENFVGIKMYECSRCFLRPKVAEKIVQIQQALQKQQTGLKMLDCFRPRPTQQKLWDKVPDPRYVTNPAKGSMHNRGAAVDLTIVDSLGQELDMGTAFDYFGQEAYHAYTNLPDSVLANRKLLKETMETFGFKPIRTEWWHYSLPGQGYPLSDMLWKCY